MLLGLGSGGLKLWEMFFRPAADRLERFDQTTSKRSEGIFNPGRNDRIDFPANDPVVFETAQRLGEHLLRNPGNLSPQFVVAFCAAR